MVFNVQSLACDRLLKVGVAEWPPYQYIDEANHAAGIDIDLLKKWAKENACQLHFISRPWNRLLDEVKKGNIDILISASKTTERQKFASFSAPYRREQIKLFVLKDKAASYPLSSLESILEFPFILGTVKGVHYGPDFNRLQQRQDFKKKLRPSQEIHLPLLLNGRFDGYLIEKNIGENLIIRLQEQDTIIAHPNVNIDNGPVHLMFSKKSISSDTIALFNQAIDKRLSAK